MGLVSEDVDAEEDRTGAEVELEEEEEEERSGSTDPAGGAGEEENLDKDGEEYVDEGAALEDVILLSE